MVKKSKKSNGYKISNVPPRRYRKALEKNKFIIPRMMERIGVIDPNVDIYDYKQLLRAIRKYTKKGKIPDDLNTHRATILLQRGIEEEKIHEERAKEGGKLRNQKPPQNIEYVDTK